MTPAASTTPTTRRARGPDALFIAHSPATWPDADFYRPRLSVDGRKYPHCSRRTRFIRSEGRMINLHPWNRGLRGREPVLAQPYIQLRPRNSELPRGLGLVPFDFAHHPLDRAALEGFDIRGVGRRRRHRPERQIAAVDHAVFADDRRALENIPELPDVAGPFVVEEC